MCCGCRLRPLLLGCFVFSQPRSRLNGTFLSQRSGRLISECWFIWADTKPIASTSHWLCRRAGRPRKLEPFPPTQTNNLFALVLLSWEGTEKESGVTSCSPLSMRASECVSKSMRIKEEEEKKINLGNLQPKISYRMKHRVCVWDDLPPRRSDVWRQREKELFSGGSLAQMKRYGLQVRSQFERKNI